MTETDPARGVGTVAWLDLTVEDAPALRDFYRDVVGWEVEEVSMGEYADYAMNRPGDSTPTAGVCHRRGVNVDLPAHWIVYVRVADLEASLEHCRAHGGKILSGPKSLGEGRLYAVIEDPAGAVLALAQGA